MVIILRLLARPFRRYSSSTRGLIRVADEVQNAVRSRHPVVALESTILTHGLPASTAIEVNAGLEASLRGENVVPATVGILDGQLIVGMSASEQSRLVQAASHGHAQKVAIRDLPLALGTESTAAGGTTVSATLYAAQSAGISVFATGGIGGVHRDAETSFDISSDLTSIADHAVAVVCAGAKSILDIAKTLEVLETLGVTVVTHNATEFPAFFTPFSGLHSPGFVSSPEEAAKLFQRQRELNLKQGLLIAVPIPSTMQDQGKQIETAIQEALSAAKKSKITGPAITPFILEHVRKVTGNRSLDANISLIQNNVRFAARMAKALNKKCEQAEVVVIGGSNLDYTVKLKRADVKHVDQLTPPGSFAGEIHFAGGGGVGRNLAEVLSKFGASHAFLTALGSDSEGSNLLKQHASINWHLAPVPPGQRSANYLGVLNHENDLLFGVADMDLHDFINHEAVRDFLQLHTHARLILFDANLSVESMTETLRYARKENIPAWFEPTDHHKCSKILAARDRLSGQESPCLELITPNAMELEKLCSPETKFGLWTDAAGINLNVRIVRKEVLPWSKHALVKLGPHGCLFVEAKEATLYSSPVQDTAKVVNASGAGDSLVATCAYFRHQLELPWHVSILAGLRASQLSLISNTTFTDASSFDSAHFSPEKIKKWAEKCIRVVKF